MERKEQMSIRKIVAVILIAPLVVSGMSFDGTRYYGSLKSFGMEEAFCYAIIKCVEREECDGITFLSATAHGVETNIYYKVEVIGAKDIWDGDNVTNRVVRHLCYTVTKASCGEPYDYGQAYADKIPKLSFPELWSSFPSNNIDRLTISSIEWEPENSSWYVFTSNMYYVVRDDIKGSNVVERVKWR